MVQSAERQQLRFVDAHALRGWVTSLAGVNVVSVSDETIGGLEGLLVDESDRPYYLVVGSPGKSGQGQLLPIGVTWYDQTSGVIRTDVTAESLSACPAFDANDYGRMSPEDSWQYEQRVLRACCPETLAEPGSRQDHYSRNTFRVPAWLGAPAPGS